MGKIRSMLCKTIVAAIGLPLVLSSCAAGIECAKKATAKDTVSKQDTICYGKKYTYRFSSDGKEFTVSSNAENMLPSMEYFYGSCTFDTEKRKVIDIGCDGAVELVTPYPKSDLEWSNAVTDYNSHFERMGMGRLIKTWECNEE